jgi:two-component system NarL family sensor kinase
METASGLEIDFHIYGQIPDIDPEFELSLYRMTQELVHNAIKHARASLLTVQFSCRQHWLGITVEDNGVGMPAEPNSGTGINNIRSRVKAVDGQMNITSDSSGTTVYLEFNLQHVKKEIPHADQISHM